MRKMMDKGRILLVDGDELFRDGVRQMLEQEEDMEIVGDCASAEEALSQMAALSPNIVLMDTWLPGMNGIDACRRLIGNGFACDVIMLTDGQELISEALNAGVTGYYPKDIKQAELATAIRLACKWQSLNAESDDGVYSIRQIEAMIMEHLAQLSTEQTHAKKEPDWPLPEDNGSASLSKVTLVISPGDASRLRKFICQAEEALQASFLEMVGSWSDTLITLRLRRPLSLANMLDKLTKIPEVEEARQEEVPVRAERFRFFKKNKAKPRKMISVTLRGQTQALLTVGQTDQYINLPKLQSQAAGVRVS